MELHLYTKRLASRSLSFNDVNLVIEIRTDEQAMKYSVGTSTKEKIVEEMEVYTRRGGSGCIGVWCICDLTTGKGLGTTGLTPLPIDGNHTDWEQQVEDQLPDGEVEIGYFLKRAAWGSGYATEAADRILRFVFEASPLEEVVAVTDPGNRDSRRALEKVGFLSTGVRLAYGETYRGSGLFERIGWVGSKDCMFVTKRIRGEQPSAQDLWL